ncbi:hypothetical protein MNEG_10382 [Monoraphidium neglectum]|uniref:Uncharacterized protein n=1 Tax=Monoraphidium neglectum TaxID=145388 RepID=A0A0D2M1R5_9CHLO|nr:hypothetical protein MNEG_10382 [Monoraphidium neglectum]KIY97579.1 hypothetical protein MNEG_10382 [Monoraphidium neglectum]|eukprot:XP_013896599.1 hypothetical protein MNEG_10382 [Monoraphidium neglectum]
MRAAISCRSGVASAPARSPRPARAQRAALVVLAAAGKENPYHDRKHTAASNPGGTKDAGKVHADKKQQFEYQQERLEWRRKNQQGGDNDADRDEPAHTNMGVKNEGSHNSGNNLPLSDEPSGAAKLVNKVVRKITGKDDE